MPRHSFLLPLLQTVTQLLSSGLLPNGINWKDFHQSFRRDAKKSFQTIRIVDFCISYLDRSLTLSLERFRKHIRHLSQIASMYFIQSRKGQMELLISVGCLKIISKNYLKNTALCSKYSFCSKLNVTQMLLALISSESKTALQKVRVNEFS